MKLFKLKGWEIHTFDDGEMPNVKVVAKHTPCPKPTHNDTVSWFADEDPAKCFLCEAPVPEEIQGLIVLHDGGNAALWQ